jgi:hypothetical protein
MDSEASAISPQTFVSMRARKRKRDALIPKREKQHQYHQL